MSKKIKLNALLITGKKSYLKYLKPHLNKEHPKVKGHIIPVSKIIRKEEKKRKKHR